MDSITKVALAIVSLALVATLVVNYTGTASVINAGSSAFTGSLKQAEAG
jgi:hypothetical protein